jgi:hypothetical protein
MATHIAGLLTHRRSIPEILSYGLWDYLFDCWYKSINKFAKQDIDLYKKRVFPEMIASSLAKISAVAVTGYIVFLVVSKNYMLTTGDVIMYSGAFTGGMAAIKSSVNAISELHENSIFLNNYLKFNKLLMETRTLYEILN